MLEIDPTRPILSSCPGALPYNLYRLMYRAAGWRVMYPLVHLGVDLGMYSWDVTKTDRILTR
jgi:hypothetical protein